MIKHIGYTAVDYVWIGGNNELRSKTRIIYSTLMISELSKIQPWNYDGSSTNQADGSDSEVVIIPRRLFKCPFRRGSNYIVMCDTYKPSGEPIFNNHRVHAQKIFDKYADQKAWFGLEQEYFICETNTGLPVGFDIFKKQGKYYCSVGAANAFCRDIVEEHMYACLYAGIHISGTNAEVAPGQWEFQVGPVEGIDASDQLWIARYILERIAEKYGKSINYQPKPFKGDINGNGLHTNFSTEAMREPDGINVIYAAIKQLEPKHHEHMLLYGENNRERMTGEHETANYDTFTYGIGNRKASIRIPNDTAKNGQGYFEDRRPSGNMDPYRVTAKILETVME